MTTRTHEPETAGRTVEHSTFATDRTFIDRTFEATPARQDASIDGTDIPGDRERGTRERFDNPAAELRRA